MDPESHAVEARKAEHLQLTANRDVNSRAGPGWADVHLLHVALPEIDLDAWALPPVFAWLRDTASIARVLHDNGYATAAIGKWHNTPEWEITPVGPFDRNQLAPRPKAGLGSALQ